MQKRERRYEQLREKYQQLRDNLAIEQIDCYDAGSPYGKHYHELIEAFKRGDDEKATQEEKWLEENYPLLNKRLEEGGKE